MAEILYVNACVRSDVHTPELAKCVLEQLSGEIEEVNLYEKSSEVLNLKAMCEQDFSDSAFALAEQFANAKTIVIAASYCNRMFPSVLLAYFEAVSAAGVSLGCAQEGKMTRFCKAQNMYYVTAAGGTIGELHFGFDYIKALAQTLFGIKNVRCFKAEGLDLSDAYAAESMKKAKEAIDLSSQEEQTIPYPEKYGEDPKNNGATSFLEHVDHGPSRYYVANDFFNMKSGGSLHILHRFKTYQQTTEYTCGAASALMVLNWFGEKLYHEKAVANLLETHPTRGSSVENIADLFDLIGWNVDYHASADRRYHTIEEAERAIVDFVDRGIPIMVDWVDWAGHWQVLIGIDTCGTESPYDDVLIFADPYDVTDHNQDGYYTYPLGRFFGMWREGPCAEKALPYQQPFVAAWPKKE